MYENTWNEIELLQRRFAQKGIGEVEGFEKHLLYTLIAHSTAIEESALTADEVYLLFDEGLTADKKSLVHHLMNVDLKEAYQLAKTEAWRKTPVTPTLLRDLNATLMRTTGCVHKVMTGSFDSTKGEYRLCNVTAGIGGRSYMSYQKVPMRVDALCRQLQSSIETPLSVRQRYELSFDAHLNLATIHPWVDGNGRTARLLMHYVQFLFNLFPTTVFEEDRNAYFIALRRSRDENTSMPFFYFMAGQLKKSLALALQHFSV